MRSSTLSLMVLGLIVLNGCQRSTLTQSSVDRFPAQTAELDYWQQLEDQRVLTNNDALHGLLMLADGKDPSAGYEQRVAAARDRGWLKSQTDPPANESATVGMVAVAVCDILDIKGGVTMWLLGPTPRYCARELAYMRIMPLRSENQAFSGLEFLDLAAKVEEERSSGAPAPGR